MAASQSKANDAETPGHRLLRFLGLEYETPEVRAGRSCVLVQIDGLSHAEFARAVEAGNLPFLANLLRSGKASAGPWETILPASTGAFQTGLFYGDNDNVPGFSWYDKAAQQEIHLNRVDDVASVEERVRKRVLPFPGLLRGGAAYTAIFTGGAKNTLLTFARLFRPSLNVGTRPRWILFFLVSQIILLGRLAYYATIELVLALYDLIHGLFSQRNKYLEFQFLFARIACVVFCREIATLAAILDIRRGVGPIYLNYLAYDEHAHHRGPSSAFARWSLRGLDASIQRIHKAIEQAEAEGIRGYDLYVWSDHGQVTAVPFQERFGQDPARHFELLFDMLHGPSEDDRSQARERRERERVGKGRVIKGQRGRRDLARVRRQADQAHELRDVLPRSLQRVYDRLLRAAKESYEYYMREDAAPPDTPRLKFVSTGPVAGLYLLGVEGPLSFENWRDRFPAFLEELSDHEGVGFALVRTKDGGASVGAGGMWVDLDDDAALERIGQSELIGILRNHRDGLRRWVNMPSAGDILLFGHRSATGPVISYSYERGAHAGPSRPEMTPFIVVPQHAAALWPEVSDGKGSPLTLAAIHQRLRETYFHNDAPGTDDG